MKPHWVLLHGALGSSKLLQPYVEILSQDFTVHHLNFSGHGGVAFSDKGFTIDVFRDEVLGYLQNQQIDHAHFFGYSMGGYVALKLALAHPNRVGKIVTLGTKFDWSLAAAEQEVKKLNPAKIEEKVPAFAQYLQQLHQPNDWKEVVTNTANLMMDLANGTALTPAQLHSITHNILVLLGSEDNMVGQQESEEAAAALPHGQFNLLEGVLHPIERVEPEKVCAALSAFMGS